MTNKINIQIYEDRHPEIYQYFKEQPEKQSIKTIQRLILEKELLKKTLDERKALLEELSEPIWKELFILRLGLREIEKDSFILKNLANTYLRLQGDEFPVPSTVREYKTSQIEYLDKAWANFIEEQQIKRSEKVANEDDRKKLKKELANE